MFCSFPNIEQKHFQLLQEIQACHKRRAEPGMLEALIATCEEQIAIAPEVKAFMQQEYPSASLPRHVGFQRLAIIREDEGNFAAAVSLCQEAKRQGWDGDWDKRIARCQAKMKS